MTCAVCAKPLIGRQTRYCSPLCASRGFTAARKADGRLREYRRRTAADRAAYQRKRLSGATGQPLVVCHVCGIVTNKIAMAGRERRVCSTMCRAYLRNAAWPSCPVSIPRSAQCDHCGYTFSTTQPHAIYCAPACRKRAQSARRDYYKRCNGPREKIRRRAVFERDEWTCQLCGFPVQRQALVPDYEAPTIDHVVPLSCGGTHTMSNVQTAHFLCNSLKSDQLVA